VSSGVRPRAVRATSTACIAATLRGGHCGAALRAQSAHSTDGKAFDGAGIPPDLQVPFFSREDLAIGRDAALDKAMEILAGGQS